MKSGKAVPMVDLERPPEASNPPEDDKAESCVITLFEGGETLDDAPLLWRDSLPDRLVEDHGQTLVTPPVEVFCIANAVLHGPGWVSKDNSILFDRTLYPPYCRVWDRSNQIYKAVASDLATLAERRYRAGWHVTHFNCGVYGHWLLEIMPKLLAMQEFLQRWPEYASMPLFMPSIFPPFVYRHARALLPRVPIVTYDPRSEYIRTDSVFMPTWGADHVFNKWLGRQTDELAATPWPGMPKTIFVSRRSKSVFRALDNLRELEAIAVQEGLTVLYPEDHSLERQIAVFQNAELVAGEFGSALHNTIFSPRGTLVIALNWINACQSRIARLKKHRIGYLLPTSGAEVVFSLDAPLQHYAIDPDGFRAKLREAMGQDARPLI
jgi:O-antigen biosynthesis protein WbqL